MALVATLWILAVLVVVVASFSFSSQTETQIAGNFANMVRAEAAARAGLERAILEVERLNADCVSLRQKWVRIDSEDDGIDLGNARYFVHGFDESGKLNLNALLAGEKADDIHEDALVRLLGRSAADALLDWCDEDNEPRPFGAEADYYSTLQPPYRPRNGPLESIDELRFVKGFNAERLNGLRGERPVETPSGERGAPPRALPLRELVTVYSVEDNTDALGRPRLHLLKATREQFLQTLGNTLTESEIDAILRCRSGDDQNRISDPVQLDRSPADAPARVNGEPPRLKTTGDLLAVPMLRDRVRAIADRVTVRDEATITGRINLNTAPAELLLSLPGMSQNIVADIQSYRESALGPFRSVGDLFNLPSVSNELYRRLADHLTVRSNAFRFVSEGSVRGSNVRRSVEAVVVLVTENPAAFERQRVPGVDTPVSSVAPSLTPAVRHAYVVYRRQF